MVEIRDNLVKITFPKETLRKFVETFTPDVEKNATLCISRDNSVYVGKPIKEGTQYSVQSITKEEMLCPAGTKPIGTIHSHPEDYSNERPPFDRGFSNEDILAFVGDALNKKIDLPYLGCVFSPTFDKKDRWNGFRIDCEYYPPFTEEDIKKMPNGVVHMKDGREIRRDTFSDEQIKALKQHYKPSGGLHAIGFTVAMANLKIGLKKHGMKQGSIWLPKTDKGIEIQDKKMVLNNG